MKTEISLKEDSEEKRLKRKRIASENTWDRRVESMIHIFDTFAKEKKVHEGMELTVIIVTFDSFPFIRGCLRSIVEQVKGID